MHSASPYTPYIYSDLSRAAAQSFANKFAGEGPEALEGALGPRNLDPVSIATQLILRGHEILDEQVPKVLKHLPPEQEGDYLGVLHPTADKLKAFMSGFVNSGVYESMSIALSIPSMQKSAAKIIALSQESCAAVLDYGRTNQYSKLRFPEVTKTKNLPLQGFTGDPRISYEPELGHIANRLPPMGKGCPLARGRGAAMVSFYATVAEVTIDNVRLPDGHHYYTEG